MDALHVLRTAQHHHHMFPELQSHWHELTLGVSPWDYLTHIFLVLHPCQILFVPEAFSKLRNVIELEIISKWCLPLHVAAFQLHAYISCILSIKLCPS